MSIRVSEQHGVNPSVEKCFFCQRDVGVVLFGRLPGDAEAPRSVTLDETPCSECRSLMDRGVILISVDEGKSGGDMRNPYRSGAWIVVTDSFIQREVAPPLRDYILQKRAAFVPDSAWDNLGLPRGAVEGVPSSLEDVKS